MQSADVLCVPSNDEGVPNVLLEAFACGLPAVATRVGGIPEVLDQSSLGVLVEPDDATQLADALGEVLRDPPEQESLVAHSRAFSWDATAASYFRLLEQATSERPARYTRVRD
jgi:glycosyltransferase involved in cell wall biosynthesis